MKDDGPHPAIPPNLGQGQRIHVVAKLAMLNLPDRALGTNSLERESYGVIPCYGRGSAGSEDGTKNDNRCGTTCGRHSNP